MRNVTLFNSLGNRYEAFVPLEEGKVSIYVCGPTVYNDPHIGNMRPVIVFDAWRRLFQGLGYEVTFVSNYTDVDDKIINRAKELGIPEKQLTEQIIAEFRRLVAEVGALQPDETPRPTVYMDQMVQYIGELVDKGAAYVADNGDVYFSVPDIPDYGCLSGNTPETLNAGARIDVKDGKRSPLDFALWKKTSEGIKWDTPWSEGRPGWHTECCVMIHSLFAKQGGKIDIHGGGFDLKFPHHENEIAQCEAHDGHKLATYWLHNGFINIDNEKMSKSLGNVLLAKDVIAKFGGMPLRFMVLNTHYRAPLAFTEETIEEAIKNYGKIQVAMKQSGVKLQILGVDLASLPHEYGEEFLNQMCNDLNTPNAITEIYRQIKELNSLLRVREIDVEALGRCYGTIAAELEMLGISVNVPILTQEDRDLLDAYNQAKAEKDFAKSDEIRGQLIAKGIL